MANQNAVRLSEDLVACGAAKSRATVVTRARERERRRALAARDVSILVRDREDADLDALAQYVVRIPADLE